jgi:hypothetical protein
MVFETIAFTDYAIRARGDDTLSPCLSYRFDGAGLGDGAGGGWCCWSASVRRSPPSADASWPRTIDPTGRRPRRNRAT